MTTKSMVLAASSLLVLAACAPQQEAAQEQERTPEEQAARMAERQAEMSEPRPIEALNSLWIEELTWMEIRDAVQGGKTTALVLTGGVESNGPHLASGKHNYSNQLMGPAVAEALGDALIAPLVTLEPGNPSRDVMLGNTGPVVSEETYIAWLTDIGDSLRGMGFTEVYFLGDSGGNQDGMAAAAEALTAKYQGEPTVFHHVPEFYNHEFVRQYIQEDLGIPEELEYTASRGSDGIHEELSIDAVMSVIDPTSIRFPQRVDAGLATINGVSLEPLAETQELGRKIIDFRTQITVDAIEALRAADGT
jgi:creatinine amidohydrolase/Fe(II)-dependent formamide hydrolase-like protein